MVPIKLIHQTIMEMADKARADNRPAPVIETDYESAKILIEALAESLGIRAGDLIDHPGNGSYMAKFDGVGITVRWVDPRELYREHFGVLADIWGE